MRHGDWLGTVCSAHSVEERKTSGTGIGRSCMRMRALRAARRPSARGVTFMTFCIRCLGRREWEWATGYR